MPLAFSPTQRRRFMLLPAHLDHSASLPTFVLSSYNLTFILRLRVRRPGQAVTFCLGKHELPPNVRRCTEVPFTCLLAAVGRHKGTELHFGSCLSWDCCKRAVPYQYWLLLTPATLSSPQVLHVDFLSLETSSVFSIVHNGSPGCFLQKQYCQGRKEQWRPLPWELPDRVACLAFRDNKF